MRLRSDFRCFRLQDLIGIWLVHRVMLVWLGMLRIVNLASLGFLCILLTFLVLLGPLLFDLLKWLWKLWLRFWLGAGWLNFLICRWSLLSSYFQSLQHLFVSNLRAWQLLGLLFDNWRDLGLFLASWQLTIGIRYGRSMFANNVFLWGQGAPIWDFSYWDLDFHLMNTLLFIFRLSG